MKVRDRVENIPRAGAAQLRKKLTAEVRSKKQNAEVKRDSELAAGRVLHSSF